MLPPPSNWTRTCPRHPRAHVIPAKAGISRPVSAAYSWEHPSLRKVTGCIHRMVRGWHIQIPAYAGMTR